jgi:nicotinamidase-related amidase
MGDKSTFDPRTSALLLMDFQTMVVEGYATDKEALLGRTAEVLKAARAARMLIIYIVVGFRAGYPEVSDRNMSFGAIKKSGRFGASGAGTEIHPQLAPQGDEVVVTKHRVGAFPGTDLDMILRSNDIETLIMTGIATSGVVLSTVRSAADADYRLVIVGDCCSDTDAEVHRVLIEKVFARQGIIASAKDVVAALQPAKA